MLMTLDSSASPAFGLHRVAAGGGGGGCCCSSSSSISQVHYHSSFFGSNVPFLQIRRGKPRNWPSSHLFLGGCFRVVATSENMDDEVPRKGKRKRKGKGKGSSFHPLEEMAALPRRVNSNGDVEPACLSNAKLARTIVEVNNCGTLMVSDYANDVHEKLVCPDLPYLTDENGGIYFEVDDDEELLETFVTTDQLVQVMIGSGSSEIITEMVAASVSELAAGDISDEESGFDDDDDDNYEEDEVGFIEEDEQEEDDDEDDDDDVSSDMPSGWANYDTMKSCHPIYFAWRISEAVSSKEVDWMDQPSSCIVLECHLIPAFAVEGIITRRRPSSGDSEADKDLISKRNGLSFFKLEVLNIHLVTAYGNQAMIQIDDFRKARPDKIAHSAAKIISRLRAGGEQITQALKSFCWRQKAMQVEEAVIIGVDSLGFDLRICSGIQVQTLRFGFTKRAKSEFSAEKQLHDLIFATHDQEQIPQARQKEC